MRSWWKQPRPDDDDLDPARSALTSPSPRRSAYGRGSDRKPRILPRSRTSASVTRTTEDAPAGVDTAGGSRRVRDLTSDVRYAIRALARNAGFSLAVIAVLAVGIGLNAAVFTLLKSLALNPLAGVERVGETWRVVLDETSTGRQASLSYPDYEHLRDHDQAFAGLIGSRNVTVNLGAGLGARADRRRSW